MKIVLFCLLVFKPSFNIEFLKANFNPSAFASSGYSSNNAEFNFKLICRFDYEYFFLIRCFCAT